MPDPWDWVKQAAGAVGDVASDVYHAVDITDGNPPSGLPDWAPVVQRYKSSLQDKAREYAKQFGVPEDVFLNLIGAESNWKVDAYNEKSGASGLGQFLPSTAAGYGVTTEQLRKDPDLALRLSAKLLSDNASNFRGDPQQWQKAAVSYLIGPGNVQEAVKAGGSDWLAAAEKIAQGHGWDSPIEYLQKIKLTDRSQSSLTESSSSTVSNPKPAYTGTGVPRPEDFYVQDLDGNWTLDIGAYQKAVADYWQTEKFKQDMSLGPVSTYIDAMVNDTAQRLKLGELNLTQANDIVQTRLTAFKSAYEALNSDVFKYGAPAGAKYTPLHEPGGFWEKNYGVPPAPLSGANTVDPFAEALKIATEGTQQIGAVQFPTIPDYAGTLKAAGTGPGSTPPYTPPAAVSNPGSAIPNAKVGEGSAAVSAAAAGAKGYTPADIFAAALAQTQAVTAQEQILAGGN